MYGTLQLTPSGRHAVEFVPVLQHPMKNQPQSKLDGCIVWNAHSTVLGSKRLAICATV